jgi:hypothetical protein
MAIRQWDEEFLQEFAARAPRLAFARQCAEDHERAVQKGRRETSDAVWGYRTCPVRRCRRARKCMVDVPVCFDLLLVSLPDEMEQAHIDEIYAELQDHRKQAAMEEEEE